MNAQNDMAIFVRTFNVSYIYNEKSEGRAGFPQRVRAEGAVLMSSVWCTVEYFMYVSKKIKCICYIIIQFLTKVVHKMDKEVKQDFYKIRVDDSLNNLSTGR